MTDEELFAEAVPTVTTDVKAEPDVEVVQMDVCLLYTSPSPRDRG